MLETFVRYQVRSARFGAVCMIASYIGILIAGSLLQK